MNQDIKALATALEALREKLVATPRTEPGFGEMRALYRELTLKLIDVGDKPDEEIATAIAATAREISEEWESNKDKLASWHAVLRPVVQAVGLVTRGISLTNPLSILL